MLPLRRNLIENRHQYSLPEVLRRLPLSAEGEAERVLIHGHAVLACTAHVVRPVRVADVCAMLAVKPVALSPVNLVITIITFPGSFHSPRDVERIPFPVWRQNHRFFLFLSVGLPDPDMTRPATNGLGCAHVSGEVVFPGQLVAVLPTRDSGASEHF